MNNDPNLDLAIEISENSNRVLRRINQLQTNLVSTKEEAIDLDDKAKQLVEQLTPPPPVVDEIVKVWTFNINQLTAMRGGVPCPTWEGHETIPDGTLPGWAKYAQRFLPDNYLQPNPNTGELEGPMNYYDYCIGVSENHYKESTREVYKNLAPRYTNIGNGKSIAEWIETQTKLAEDNGYQWVLHLQECVDPQWAVRWIRPNEISVDNKTWWPGAKAYWGMRSTGKYGELFSYVPVTVTSTPQDNVRKLINPNVYSRGLHVSDTVIGGDVVCLSNFHTHYRKSSEEIGGYKGFFEEIDNEYDYAIIGCDANSSVSTMRNNLPDSFVHASGSSIDQIWVKGFEVLEGAMDTTTSTPKRLSDHVGYYAILKKK